MRYNSQHSFTRGFWQINIPRQSSGGSAVKKAYWFVQSAWAEAVLCWRSGAFRGSLFTGVPASRLHHGAQLHAPLVFSTLWDAACCRTNPQMLWKTRVARCAKSSDVLKRPLPTAVESCAMPHLGKRQFLPQATGRPHPARAVPHPRLCRYTSLPHPKGCAEAARSDMRL